MREEDLSLSAFIAGAAIGYLGWYVVFWYSHHRRTKTSRPYEQFFSDILAISCAVILVFFSHHNSYNQADFHILVVLSKQLGYQFTLWDIIAWHFVRSNRSGMDSLYT